MKKLIYIKLVFLLLFNYNSGFKKEYAKKFRVEINFTGNTDKPLPTLIFSDCPEETLEIFHYNYVLNYNSYLDFKKTLKRELNSKKNSSLIHILLNRKHNYYFNKKNSMLLISKLLIITKHKNNKVLNDQLNLYLRSLKNKS